MRRGPFSELPLLHRADLFSIFVDDPELGLFSSLRMVDWPSTRKVWLTPEESVMLIMSP